MAGWWDPPVLVSHFVTVDGGAVSVFDHVSLPPPGEREQH